MNGQKIGLWGIWKTSASGEGSWVAYGYDRIRVEYDSIEDATHEVMQLNSTCLNGSVYAVRELARFEDKHAKKRGGPSLRRMLDRVSAESCRRRA